MQRKINDMMICLRMRKNLTAKTPPGDFQVTTPETPLLSQQTVTSKESQVPYNLQLNPYPNTQSDLFCSDSSPFWCTAPKYMTHQLRGSQYVTSITNLKRLLATKFFSSSKRWRSGRCLVTKPYGANTQQLLQERDELGQELCLRSQFAWTEFYSMLVQLVYRLTALETIILYV